MNFSFPTKLIIGQATGITFVLFIAITLLYYSIENKSESEFESRLTELSYQIGDQYSTALKDAVNSFSLTPNPLRENLDEIVLKNFLPGLEAITINLYDSGGREVWNTGNESFVKLPSYKQFTENGTGNLVDGINTFQWNNDISSFTVIINKQPDYMVYIAYSGLKGTPVIASIIDDLIWLIPVLLVLSVALSILISFVITKPIESISEQVRNIKTDSLDIRINSENQNKEIRALTADLNELIERFENSYRKLREFTSDVSHELRTPLTIIRGELETALREPRTIEDYEYTIASAIEEVLRITNLVQTLLELSRADSGRIKMNFADRDLSALLKDIEEDAEILAQSKSISVNSEIQEKINCYVDLDRIHQALLNIIDNAIKYTPEGGEIRIRLQTNGDSADISIKDTGIGIDKENISRIFDRFYRADEVKKSKVHGLGLGLSIASWIIKEHKGKIEVESKPEKGTEFRIKLPLNNIAS